MPQACEGIKVLDFTQGMAGALATMWLADNGAEVIKVEPPSGDPARAKPAFLQWARGKKSVVLDLKGMGDVDMVRALAREADVLIESFRPGVAQRLGIGYRAMKQVNPTLVYCSISGFGQKGPYTVIKGYDAVVAAKTGRMLWKRPWRREGPLFEAVPRTTSAAAHLAVQGVLAALLARKETRRGTWVQTSLIQGWLAHAMSGWMVPVGKEEARLRHYDAPLEPGDPHEQMPAGYTIARCKDGRYIQMTSTTVHLFRNFVHLLGLQDVYKDSRFKDIPYTFPTPEDRRKFMEAIKAKLAEKTSEEWSAIFRKDGVTGGEPYITTKEFMGHPQALHDGLVIEVDDPRVGRMKQIGPLVAFSETPSRVQGPAPDLGQHTETVLARVSSGASPWSSPPERLPASSAPRKRPLDGVTIIEVANYYAAPFGITILGEMGARVIKVEALTGDLFRRIPEGFPKTVAGKESIAIDLKTAEGRDILNKLLRKADAVMHNFRPGGWKDIGLAYENVSRVNPRIVYLYAGSYGSSGPYSKLPAFHPLVSAITGAGVRLSGEGNPPMDTLQGDPDAALGVATALLLGLHARERTGKGQYMETRMISTGAYTVSDEFLDYRGKLPERLPNSGQHGFHALYRLYDTGKGWVFLAAPQEKEWLSLCEALGCQGLLADPRFRDAPSRLRHDAELVQAIEGVLKGRIPEELEALLLPEDVACVRADGRKWSAWFYTDPSVRENGWIAEASHPHFGAYHRQGPMVEFSDMEPRLAAPATIGEHTESILREFGYTADQIKGLEQRKVVLSNGPFVFAGVG